MKLIAHDCIDWKAERDRIDLAALATNRLGPAIARGGRLWWCCPFHEDRSPSFCIKKGKPWWRCFGCDAHGDAATLVMKLDQKSFPEAIASLVGEKAPSRRSSGSS